MCVHQNYVQDPMQQVFFSQYIKSGNNPMLTNRRTDEPIVICFYPGILHSNTNHNKITTDKRNGMENLMTNTL